MRSKHKKYYRHPKTTQERRANQDGRWYRGKRGHKVLVNAWDDEPTVTRTKSWKDKRKTQYRDGPRGQMHSVSTTRFYDELSFRHYCTDFDIPHRVEIITERVYFTSHWVQSLWNENEGFWRRKGWFAFIGIDPTDYKITNKTKEFHYNKIVGYELVWWYDKDICIERVLNYKR